MMSSAERMQHPAEYLLSFKSELGLSTDQQSLLADIAKAQQDSMPVRMARMMSSMQERQRSPGTAAKAMAWSGDIDEKAVRAEACEQATAQTEIMLGIMRDRRVAGGVLTESQRAQLPEIEMAAMMKRMNVKQP
jgi:Spy/CpxP family protein refolding chaperone